MSVPRKQALLYRKWTLFYADVDILSFIDIIWCSSFTFLGRKYAFVYNWSKIRDQPTEIDGRNTPFLIFSLR